MPFAILDTFPEFLRYWESVRLESLDRQIEAWRADYLAAWPELASLQIDDYAGQGLNWREVARRRIFPFVEDRLSDMQRAHDVLVARLPEVDAQARRALQVEFDLTYLVHVGLGCGAGWATEYAGRLAVLFGLENAAEEEMVDADSLDPLIAHEFGHLAFRHWRRAAALGDGAGPWWQLVDEGMARTGQERILAAWSAPSPKLADGWETWCEAHRAWLAQEFIDTVRRGEPVNRFFGSWLEVGGRSETGYYMGEQVVKEWEREQPLAEIARWEAARLERRARDSLEAMAREVGPGVNAHGLQVVL